MKNESLKGKIDCIYGESALQIINLSEKLFKQTPQNLPYNCQSNKKNMELHNLEHGRFREDYYQMESESGVRIPAYARDIGSYDEPDVEILTEKEWLTLSIRPPRIAEIKKEIRDGENGEFFTGIKHYRNYTGWYVADMMKTIEVPKLEFRTPESVD